MALPKFYKVCQDQQGNIVPQVLGSVFNHGTAVLASLYQDDAGTVPLSNPMTSDAQYGSFKFYVNPGHYDLTFTKPGYTFEPIFDMQVPQDVLTVGSMAYQNANAVAITGGSATGLSTLGTVGDLTVSGTSTLTGLVGIGRSPNPGTPLVVSGGSLFQGDVEITGVGRFARVGIGRPADPTHVLILTGSSRLDGRVAVNGAPLGNTYLNVEYPKNTGYGIALRQNDTDGGTGAAVAFLNLATGIVGTISTSATATAYNTSSDSRLKTGITPLTGALDVIRRLVPRRFRWKRDGSLGHGFVAEEVAAVVDGVTSGTPGAVDAQGQVDPMGMDNSKLVVWAIAALQEVLVRLEAVEARLAGAPAGSATGPVAGS